MQLALIEVKARRDATTIPAVVVFAHELPILQHLYGAEYVETGAPAGMREIEADGEYDRLVRQYGEEAVISVYAHPGRLADALQASGKSLKGKSDAATA